MGALCECKPFLAQFEYWNEFLVFGTASVTQESRGWFSLLRPCLDLARGCAYFDGGYVVIADQNHLGIGLPCLVPWHGVHLANMAQVRLARGVAWGEVVRRRCFASQRSSSKMTATLWWRLKPGLPLARRCWFCSTREDSWQVSVLPLGSTRYTLRVSFSFLVWLKGLLQRDAGVVEAGALPCCQCFDLWTCRTISDPKTNFAWTRVKRILAVGSSPSELC